LVACLGLGACRPPAAPPPPLPPAGPSPAESAAALEALTDKAPVRLVWLEGPRLYYFDSVQPAPPRLLRESAGQERPVLAPDGAAVLVTDGGRIIALTLPAGEERILTVGHAMAAIREPESRRDWVYATETPDGQKAFRFQLHDASQREPVWDGAPIDPRSAQVSRDGRRLIGKFFGQDGGAADLVDRKWSKISSLRPLALAPDASHVSAMLDGTGRRLRFFHPAGEPWDLQSDDLNPPARWQAPLPEALWAGPESRYTDLRWSNHPRFMVLTEPGGAKAARLALARLAPTAGQVEALAVVAAVGPEVRGAEAWVGGGSAASLQEWPASPPTFRPESHDANGLPRLWPRSLDGASFLWDTRLAANHLPDHEAPCRLTPRGTARFGEWGDLLLDGGTFEADTESARAVAAAASATNVLTLQMLLTESTDQEGPLSTRLAALQLTGNRDAFSLSRVDQSLVFRALLDAGDGTPPREYQSHIAPLAIAVARPFYLLLELKQGLVTWTIDGQQIGDPQPLGPPSLAGWRPAEVTRLVFGDETMRSDNGWRARMEKILILNRSVPFDELRDNRANAAAATARRPGSVVRVRATLLESPPLPVGASGPGRLVQQLYEVREVLSGQLKTNPLPVWHWAELDGRPVPSRPTEIGRTYDLRVSTLLRQRQTELEETHLGRTGLPDSGYLDVAPPQNPPTLAPVPAPTADHAPR